MSVEQLSPALRDCDLCVVGAGYAALNGLNAAAKYMKKGERVVFIDKRSSWGGQWIEQYDFVRLHQPYFMFTAGDQPWRLPGRSRTYLATRREVLEHLETVPRRSAPHLEIEALFGHAYLGHRRVGDHVEIDVADAAGKTRRRLRAKRLLKGTGSEIEILRPFTLSSARVRSVAVSDPVLMTPEFLDSEAPVYVIGSGKTAMDVVGWLAAQRKGSRRKVVAIIGGGMYFFSRDRIFPTGASRFVGGSSTTEFFLRIVELFDGTNDVDVMRQLERERAVYDVFGDAANCRYGLLSSVERDAVLARVNEVIRGHLIDVDGTRMAVRERGQERVETIPEGSWFINCTSHLLPRPHEALLQDGGLVCAPQNVLGFSGTSAYFLTHLWFRDELGAVADRLFRVELDVEPKLRLATEFALGLIANLGLITRRLPLSVPMRFEGDFAKWYPLYKQVPDIVRMLARHRSTLAKAERLLPLRFTDAPKVKALPVERVAIRA